MHKKYTDEFIDKLTWDEMQKLFENDPDFYTIYTEHHKRKSPDSPNIYEMFLSLIMGYKIVASKGETTFGLPPEAIDGAKSLDTNRSLLRSGWLISPYLKENKNNNDFIYKPISLFHDIIRTNELIVNIFYSNNMFHLRKMIESWSKNRYFIKRMNFFKESIELIKVCIKEKSNISVYNFIIPFLISQIDGIKNDFLVDKGYELKGGKLNYNDKPIKDWELLSIHLAKEKNNNEDYYFKIMVKELLFGKAFPQEDFIIDMNKKSNKYIFNEFNDNIFVNFNRHKIMHGEDLKYGNRENLLRVCLILDFMNDILR